MMMAAQAGSLDAGKVMIDRGVPVNWNNANGVTPLHVAACNNQPEFVRMLLMNGADPGAICCMEKTAMDHALDHGHVFVEMAIRRCATESEEM